MGERSSISETRWYWMSWTSSSEIISLCYEEIRNHICNAVSSFERPSRHCQEAQTGMVWTRLRFNHIDLAKPYFSKRSRDRQKKMLEDDDLGRMNFGRLFTGPGFSNRIRFQHLRKHSRNRTKRRETLMIKWKIPREAARLRANWCKEFRTNSFKNKWQISWKQIMEQVGVQTVLNVEQRKLYWNQIAPNLQIWYSDGSSFLNQKKNEGFREKHSPPMTFKGE